jgi:hypothetical protein
MYFGLCNGLSLKGFDEPRANMKTLDSILNQIFFLDLNSHINQLVLKKLYLDPKLGLDLGKSKSIWKIYF